MQRSDQKYPSHPCFYGGVFNKSKKFKSNTSKLVISLKNHVHLEYDCTTIVFSLRPVFFVDNIGNLLVELTVKLPLNLYIYSPGNENLNLLV